MFQLRRRARLSALLVVLGLSACAAPPPSQPGPAVDEATVTARVKAGLGADPSIRAVFMTVETIKGVVYLSGFADSRLEAQRAEDIARRVAGAREVRNDLVVRRGSVRD
jgi:osmotically-inducible protein OsmY